jgi:peroxiredoxin Q/BCP
MYLPALLQATPGDLVALSSFKGSKTVVCFFYPKDDTPGCTKEACSFRDSYAAFVDAGAEVIGISSDGRASHEAFRARHKLPYTLLSDERNFLRQGFGVPSDLFGMLPGRQTYVISKDAKCLLVFNSQMDVEKHVSEALAVIKAAAK